MRLDKLTIGSEKDSPSHQFKNLKNVTIDFDQDQWVTVVIGWNGTGKSNVLEALAIIFRELIGSKKPRIEFAFKLAYRMGSEKATHHVHIDADPDREKDQFIIHVAADDEARSNGTRTQFIEGREEFPALRGKRMKLNTFLNAGERYLPRYVFSYYSGESTRMYEVFRPYLESYDSKLRNAGDPGLKRLFYAMPVHSQFVLLAFLIQKNEVVREFLDEHLGLDPDEGIESVLFVMRQPPWKSREGDPRFWNARGVVSDFLARLYDIALAPITVSRRVPTSVWNTTTLEFKYLFVKDIEALRELVGNKAPAEFFRDLESTHVSQLIEEVRIRVRLKKNVDSVTFRELSEGEQQLLTVLGLMCFTAGRESLFLLDEPDTHLNPKWCVDYLDYLQRFAGTDPTNRETSHIVLTTHNPLAIAELVKEQVQILQLKHDMDKRCIVACHPDMDPRGQGYAAIVTSDMFGIASSLDRTTQNLLEKQRLYAGKPKLNAEELRALDDINAKLERLGFRFFLPDDEYSRYLRLRYQKLEAKFTETDPEKMASRVLSMSRDEREKLADELIEALMRDED